MPDIIKLKRSTKSIANTSNKVLEKDEVLAVSPDAGSGKGKYELRFGDGVTPTKDLPIALGGDDGNADNLVVTDFTTPSDENPVLSAGETVKVLFGKVKKKFTYLENLVGNVKTVTNLFGSTDAKTVAQGLQILVNTKLNKSDLYDGTDSTSTLLGATANAVRKVNEKTDNNTTSISMLNSNLNNIQCGVKIFAMPFGDQTINVDFPVPFKAVPAVSFSFCHDNYMMHNFIYMLKYVTATGFAVRINNPHNYVTENCGIHWVAVCK